MRPVVQLIFSTRSYDYPKVSTRQALHPLAVEKPGSTTSGLLHVTWSRPHVARHKPPRYHVKLKFLECEFNTPSPQDFR